MATTEDFADGGEGLKRICQNCSTKYYDLNMDPIICPNCGAEFDPEAVLSSRRNRISDDTESKETKDISEEEDETEELGAEKVAEEEIPLNTDDDDEEDTFEDNGSDDTLLVEEDDGDGGLGDLMVGGDEEEEN